MTTLLEFESGRIAVDGKEVGRRDSEIRADIGIVFQQSLLDPRLTVRENLESRALFYSVSRSHVNELIELIVRYIGRVVVIILLRIPANLLAQFRQLRLDRLNVAHSILTISKWVRISARIS